MHLHMSYSEIKNLPARYRKWFVERLIKHFKQANEKHVKPNEDRQIDKFLKFEDQIKKKLS
jgi:hypothetical protein